MTRWSLALLTALSTALAGAAVAAPSAYRLTDLGVAKGYSSSFAYGLSDDGSQVAGWVAADDGSTRAATWSLSGGIQLLAVTSGATASRAFSINDAGQAAGETAFGSRREATLWSAGSATGLGTLSNAGSSVAFGINNTGSIVGWSDSSADTRAFSWTSASGRKSLGVLPGGTQSRAYAINAAGEAAGWVRIASGDRGFAATGAGLGAIDPITAGTGRTRAFGSANDNGWITGDAQDPTLGDVAFVWSPTTGTVSLGLITGAKRSFGADVNSAGLAVGWADGLPTGEQAFLWGADTGMVALDSLLIDSGWSVQRARAISDNGVIVGHALDADGQVHAVMLTPVPEPSTLALMVGGLLAVAAIAGRRQHAGRGKVSGARAVSASA